VANYNDDTVQRVPVATGVPGPAIATGRNPDALVFDGANMWVANANGDSVQKEP
jgi:hypothetical protein